MWFGPSVDGRDDHYLQHQDHNGPSVYQVFFQDLVARVKIGLGREKGGLY